MTKSGVNIEFDTEKVQWKCNTLWQVHQFGCTKLQIQTSVYLPVNVEVNRHATGANCAEKLIISAITSEHCKKKILSSSGSCFTMLSSKTQI